MKKVSIYSTPTCTYCQMSKKFFTDNGVEYTDFDVSADEAKRNEMVQKSGQMGVPVIVVADESGESEELVVGFDESKLKDLLEIS